MSSSVLYSNFNFKITYHIKINLLDVCTLTYSKCNMRKVDFRRLSTDLVAEHLGQTKDSLVYFHRPLSQNQLRTYVDYMHIYIFICRKSLVQD